MSSVALLTMDNLKSEIDDDELLVPALEASGRRVETLSWRRADVDWSRFEAVVIRTTWDYHNDPDAFVAALERIHESGARLENPLDLVRWNLAKTYLRELERRGLPVVPTVWGRHPTHEQAREWRRRYGGWVIKPVVSASATDTFSLPEDASDEALDVALGRFADRDFMVQPFMSSIANEGEYSLFFFGGELSHTVLKSPEDGDFRVQEEYGGRIQAVEPEPVLLRRAEEVLASLRPEPLYARLDLVRSGEDFALMEVELIEPSFYLRYDSAAADRFAAALDRRCATGGRP